MVMQILTRLPHVSTVKEFEDSIRRGVSGGVIDGIC